MSIYYYAHLIGLWPIGLLMFNGSGGSDVGMWHQALNGILTEQNLFQIADTG